MKNFGKPFLIAFIIISVIAFFVQVTIGDVGALQALIVSPIVSGVICLGGLAGVLESGSTESKKQMMLSCSDCGHVAPGIVRCPKCGSLNIRRFYI